MANRVLVSGVRSGSTSAQTFKVGDHIIDINDVRVTDGSVAKQLIVNAIKVINIYSFLRLTQFFRRRMLW